MNINKKIKDNFKNNKAAWYDLFYIVRQEFYKIFTDKGTIILFFVACLLYPLICGYVYNKELMRDSPIAVVDTNNSTLSRQLIRMIDSTPEVAVSQRPTSLQEAKQLQKTGKIHGIVYIPKDFSSNINKGQTATIGVYYDLTSFFWYRNFATAISFASQTMGYNIQAKNLIARGMPYNEAVKTVRPFVPEEQVLYNIGGYPSFILPIALILILQQTLFMGIGVLAGKSSEKTKLKHINPNNIHYRGLFRVIFGRMIAVFVTYIPITIFVLIIIPHFFNLPQLCSVAEILIFVIPFLLASILLGMTCSTFFYHRENAITFFIFMSLPILFLSGIPWPKETMPTFWRYFSYIIPSTYGANGFARLSTMGANLIQVSMESFRLWILVGVYFTTTFFAYKYRVHKSKTKMQQ